MKVTEANFIAQLKIKNEKALEYVLAEYGWVINSVAKKHLYRTPEFTGECLNDVLLAVWQNIDAYDKNRSTFQNWLAGITRYKAVDCKRKYLRYLQEDPLEEADRIPDPRCTGSLSENEILEEIEDMLTCLSEKDKVLFKRLLYDDEPVEVIAEAMHMEKSAIYNRISRGKKKIRRNYEKERKAQEL